MVDELVSGKYRTQFKGHGVQFSEHRVYVAGDDVRHIDWKVSARSKELLIKQFEEEREVQVMLVVDISGSHHFGSADKLKSEVVAELSAMMAFAAVYTGDKVGALFFSDQVEHTIPPRRGRSHVQRIIRDILGVEPKSRGTNIARALESVAKTMKHRGIVFVLSDFMDEGYEIALRKLSQRHDVIAISIRDPREDKIPKIGSLWAVDPETGQEVMLDTSSYRFQKWFKESRETFEVSHLKSLRTAKTERLEILTHGQYADALIKFFRMRASRKSKVRSG